MQMRALENDRGSIRACTECKRTLDKSSFYSKGERLSSRCKSCELKAKKKSYRVKKGKEEVRQVSKFQIEFVGDPDPLMFAQAIRPVVESLLR